MARPRKKATAENLAAEAQFVFRGTVVQVAGATLDQVPLTKGTLVVRVEEILKGPEILQGVQGTDITVQLAPGQRVETGRTYLFYTNGWLYGASLAVLAIGVAPDIDTHRRSARMALEATPARAMRERARRAELVVSGQVTAVREAARPRRTPITEHDPRWQEAVVSVDAVHDAAASRSRKPKQVVIRFAASPDVRWARAPKFAVGQSGVWMLGDKDKKASTTMRMAAGAQKDQYVVVDPEDFYPAESIDRVRALLK